jgi:hypothetical protein
MSVEPDGPVEREQFAEEHYQHVLEQMDIDADEADDYSEDPEQFDGDAEYDRDAMRTIGDV